MSLLNILLLVTTLTAADPRQDLIRLEQQLTEALVRSDVDILKGLWADDLVWIGLNGKPSSKAERLASMKDSAPSTTTVLSAKNIEIQIRIYGDMAIANVLSTWTTRTDAAESKSDYMATHVWKKQRGKWLLTSAHISRLP